MNPIRIAIADDDAGMRLVMRKLIERAEGYELVGEAADGEQLLELFDEKRPQVLMLDVEMPVIDGVSCAKTILDRAPLTIIIFSTAHEQYMREAFELYAFDYLLKPFKVERALKTLSLVKERLSGQDVPTPVRPAPPREEPKRLMLKHRDGVSFVDLSELVLVQREERMTVLYTLNGQRYVTSDSLSELEARLPSNRFFRSHKSYIINLQHVESISPYGRWTYVVTLRGTPNDALITSERFEIMQSLFL